MTNKEKNKKLEAIMEQYKGSVFFGINEDDNETSVFSTVKGSYRDAMLAVVASVIDCKDKETALNIRDFIFRAAINIMAADDQNMRDFFEMIEDMSEEHVEKAKIVHMDSRK